MNDNIDTIPTMDNDQIDALMAKLHNPDADSDVDGDAGDSEAAQPEGAFIAEDSTSRQLN